MDDIKDLPEELHKYIVSTKSEKKSYNDIKIFAEYLNDTPDAKKFEPYLKTYAQVFISILKNTEISEENNELGKNITVILDLLATTDIPEEEKNGNILYIEFLRDLYRNRYLEDSKNLVIRYKEMKDIVEQTKFIFTIRRNNKLLFPINNIILNLVKDFNVDKDNLINLAVSLQFYNVANSFLSAKDEDIEKEINEISSKYNIKFLDYLMDNGELININDTDFYENGTLIFRKNNKFLIRNVKKEYFDYEDTVDCEKNEKNEPIAYFIEKDYKEPLLVKSLDEVFLENSYKLKQKVFKEIIERKVYNIFFEKCILIKENNNQFVNFINPYSHNDLVIASTNNNLKVEESSLYNFFKILDTTPNFKKVIIAKNGANLISLDFITKFYLEVIGNEESFPSIEFNSNSIFQNEIIEKYFCLIFKSEERELIKSAIKNIYEFLNKYLFSINEQTKMDEIKCLIFPYRINLDSIIGDKNKLMQLLFFDNDFPIENFEFCDISIVKGIKTKFLLKNGTENIELVGYNLEKESITIDDIGTQKNIICGFVNTDEKVFYYDNHLNEIYNIIKNMYEKLNANNYLLDYNLVNRIDSNSFNDLSNIIFNVGLDNINYKVIDKNYMTSTRDKMVIVYYKLIYHFHLFNWNKERIDLFFNLILKKHFVKSAINYEQTITEWFKEVNEFHEEEHTLVIRKENDRNQGTLELFINDIDNKHNYRKKLYQSKEVELIKNLSEDITGEGCLTYYDKKVEKIVFLTDNIMGGCSTIKMLKNYLEEDYVDKHNQYIKIKELTSKYIIKDEIPIIVKSIWGYEDGKINIENYNNKINVQIACTIPEKYKKYENLEEDLIKLYSEERINFNRIPKYLFIRAYNMPARSIYHYDYFNTKKLIGLFNRKEEVSYIKNV